MDGVYVGFGLVVRLRCLWESWVVDEEKRGGEEADEENGGVRYQFSRLRRRRRAGGDVSDNNAHRDGKIHDRDNMRWGCGGGDDSQVGIVVICVYLRIYLRAYPIFESTHLSTPLRIQSSHRLPP